MMVTPNENPSSGAAKTACYREKVRGMYVPIFFICLCLLLLTARQFFVTHRMLFEGEEYPTSEAAFTNLRTACDPQQTVILGDSVPLQGIDPRLLDPSVLNAAFGGTTPVEIYFIVKNLWHCDIYPKKVILSFTTHHFFFNNGYWMMQDRITTPADRLQLRLDSYRLDDSSIYNIWPKRSSPDTEPQDKLSEFLQEVQFPSIYTSTFKRFASSRHMEKNRKIFEFMTQESRGYYTRGEGSNGHISAEHVDINREFAPHPIIDNYFDKLVGLLHERGIQVYYLQMPISEILHKTQRESFRREFIDYMTEKSHRLDFKVIGTFFATYPDEDFIDDSHLKNSGAQLFTRNIAPLMPH